MKALGRQQDMNTNLDGASFDSVHGYIYDDGDVRL